LLSHSESTAGGRIIGQEEDHRLKEEGNQHKDHQEEGCKQTSTQNDFKEESRKEDVSSNQENNDKEGHEEDDQKGCCQKNRSRRKILYQETIYGQESSESKYWRKKVNRKEILCRQEKIHRCLKQVEDHKKNDHSTAGNDCARQGAGE